MDRAAYISGHNLVGHLKQQPRPPVGVHPAQEGGRREWRALIRARTTSTVLFSVFVHHMCAR